MVLFHAEYEYADKQRQKTVIVLNMTMTEFNNNETIFSFACENNFEATSEMVDHATY